MFPKQYDLMALLLLEALTERLGSAEAERELRALGAKLAGQLKHKVRGGTLAERAESIAGLMRDLGYASSAPHHETPTIEALNCIFHELARADRSVCSLDVSLISALSGAEVEHRACMARGDNACVFCLRQESEVRNQKTETRS
jgi:predicted ArsR family transcriptional regulator